MTDPNRFKSALDDFSKQPFRRSDNQDTVIAVIDALRLAARHAEMEKAADDLADAAQHTCDNPLNKRTYELQDDLDDYRAVRKKSK